MWLQRWYDLLSAQPFAGILNIGTAARGETELSNQQIKYMGQM